MTRNIISVPPSASLLECAKQLAKARINTLLIVKDKRLFGIKDGDMVIPNLSRMIVVRGLTLHGIIGRQIFKTWQIAQRILNDKTNGVADAIWNVILKSGKGTILNFKDFTPEGFEKAMSENPKILFKIKG